MKISCKLIFALLLSIFSYPVFSALPAPQTISPAGSTVSQSGGLVNFSWTPVAGAASYSLTGYAIDNNGSIVWEPPLLGKDLTTQEANCVSGSTCSTSLSVTATSGTWKVRAIDPNNQKGDYSAYTPFTLSSAPPPNTSSIPQPILPMGSATRQSNGSVNFSWTSVTGSVSYYISGYPTDSNGNIVWGAEAISETITSQSANCSTISTCSVALSVGINSGAWKVRAIYANNQKSDYSNYAFFTLNASSGGALPVSVPYANWTPASASSINIPNFLSYNIDLDTGKKVWRLGGSQNEMNTAKIYPTGSSDSISALHGQHFYSRISVSNKDETFAIGNTGNNSGYAALWRVSDKKLVAWVPASLYNDSDARSYYQKQILWDRNSNNVYWYIKNNQIIKVTINLSDFTTTSAIYDTFNNYDQITFGNGEGNFSDDGSKIVIVGYYNGNINSYIIPYNVNTKNKGTPRYVAGNSGRMMDWAAVDPTGQYIVFDIPISNNSAWTWAVSFNNATGTPWLLYKNVKHSDFVIDKNAEPWIVLGNWKGVVACKLSSSLMKRVWPSYEVNNAGDGNIEFGTSPVNSSLTTASGHMSRVKNRSGMVLMSRFMDGGLYYIDIDKPSESIYVGNTRHGKPYQTSYASSIAKWGVDDAGETKGYESYKREPRGNASPSGRYVFFVSDYHAYGNTYDMSPPMTAFLNMIELW
ncbi:hypothetical protein [Thiothrix winogradskyi]|uniref:Fibronectin type-III domain-containing protein n=1 Tax=Thiothrix winogradskyi TaxID=96472 RepID=A0ABY3T0Q4_9GAMM|nr:hypothetical protein [Thiothrix winogradskyi]UJS25084.1 hypothetical protein L2Y54_03350 [Thiothrix winogradskyi]